LHIWKDSPPQSGRESSVKRESSTARTRIDPARADDRAGAFSWSIDQIVAARDQQMAGRFRLPARLAESFGTDSALFAARNVRLAPVQSLDVRIVPGKGPKADKIADEA
jgi:hypothetical protein